MRASEDSKGVGNDPHRWPGGKQRTRVVRVRMHAGAARADTGGDVGESKDVCR